MLCGTGAGKTEFAPAMLLKIMQEAGQGNYLAASATYPVFLHSFLPAMKDYFCRKYKVNGKPWGVYKEQKHMIEGQDGTRIICRSGVDPNALESGQFKGAILDEWGQDKIPIESWEAVNRRLGRFNGRILIPTTPYTLGWLKQQVYDRAIGGDPRYAVISFPSVDNPSYPVDTYERARRELPDWKFQMFYNGIFTKPAGLIYQDYEDSYAELEPVYDDSGRLMRLTDHGGGHLCKPFAIPAHWLRLTGHDFGASLHNAGLAAAVEPGTGNHYLYRDISHIDRTGVEQARDWHDYNEPIMVSYGGAPSEDDARHEWALAGFPVQQPPISEVEPGIDRVIGVLRTRRLFVFDTLTGVRSDLGTYSRELDDAGEPTMKIKDKEKWHRMDALRYLCSGIHIDRPPVPIIETYDPHSRTIESIKQQKRIFGMGDENNSKRREYAR
jgi:hypothetical protein